MRAVLGILTAGLILLTASPSDACGFWRLSTPDEKKLVASFYVHSARAGGKAFRVEYDNGDYVAKIGKRRWAELKGNTLYRRGKVVGEIDGHKITVRGAVYEVEFSRLSGSNPRPYFGAMRVKRDGIEVYRSARVMSFAVCSSGMNRQKKVRDVTARLAFALLRMGKRK
jgi:hypothetical protein